MAQNQLYDLRSNAFGDVSLQPGSSVSGGSDTNGDWIDMQGAEGPVQAACMTGTASGSPSSQENTFRLQQADDNSGTNSEDIPGKKDAVISEDKGLAFAQALHTRRFVRVVAKDNFSGGTSPSQDVAAAIIAQDKSF